MNPKIGWLNFSLFLLGACSADPTPDAAKDARSRSGVLAQHIDRAQRPQDDFYRYVNGGWLANVEIPADKSNYGAFTMLSDRAEADLRAILEEAARAAESDADRRRIGDFYASFLDEGAAETLGIRPLETELKRIAAIHTPRDLAAAMGHLQRIGVQQPIAYFVNVDRRQSTAYISYLRQAGLGMPDRDYYLSDDPKMRDVRARYRQYVSELLVAAGVSAGDASVATDRIVALETRLAQAHWTRVQNRDQLKTYNKYEMRDLQAWTPSIDWRAFLAGAASPNVAAMVVAQPSFLKELDAVVEQTPLTHWREYLRYKLLSAYAPYLSRRFVDLHFEFTGRTLSGAAELRPRWKRGVAVVEDHAGELLGKLYVQRHFSEDAKRRVQALVANLRLAYAAGIEQLEWMSPATKKQAQLKLSKFTAKIGYPDKWRDWSALQIRRDDLIGNVMRASIVDFDRDVAKLGQPVDRTEWHMTPQTVNAYYNPPGNEVVFPAAILQPPFFDPHADDAINYGAIGSVVGHELSHGFDDQGRHYDGDGNLKDWWTADDDREFRRRATALAQQYSAYSPLPEQHVNGELTLGENIADLGGVAMAHRAYLLSLGQKKPPLLDGYSGVQRFFIGWAQVWARKYRDDELRKRLLTDPHSPSEYRVNGVLLNQPAFAKAFALKPGDRLYAPSAQQIKIW